MSTEARISILCSLLSGVISLIVSLTTTHVTNLQSLELSRQAIKSDWYLEQRMDDLEQKRRQPNLQIVRTLTGPYMLQSTLQNTGQRTAVLFGLHLSEEAMKGALPTTPALIDTGKRADCIDIDLTSETRFHTHEFSPPITIEPGQVVFIRIKLPSTVPIMRVQADTNSEQQWIDLGHVVSP
jgi:hypothetical protein